MSGHSRDAALIAAPPVIATAAMALGLNRFVLPGDGVDAWFAGGSDTLWITFGSEWTAGGKTAPWLQARAVGSGVSILGIIAHRKDWLHHSNTATLLGDLNVAGFFKPFRRVIFIGASTGATAALRYAQVLPGSVVLAFAPHAPADDVATNQAEVYVLYDPFVPDDKHHANRILGPNVRHFHLDHFGHRVIRSLNTNDALQVLLDQVTRPVPDLVPFAKALRGRRRALTYQRALLTAAEQRGHAKLVLTAAHALLRRDPTAAYPLTLHARLGPVPEPGQPVQPAITQRFGTAIGPFRGEVQTISGAYVVPERDHDVLLASGVLLADRSYAPLSRAWVRAGKTLQPPTLSPYERVIDLPGRHLYLGHLRSHFGHFLVESTARLWALDCVKDRFDSLLYLPYRRNPATTAQALQAASGFMALMGIDIPLQAHTTALRVEQLHLPELGFGWKQRFAGAPAYRRFMQDRMNRAARAQGSDKLYISRSGLNPQHGGVLCEWVIEENLARLGYDIFHPEDHPLAVQIARYKAATDVIALDGSALHLAAYVLQSNARVAMILRRSRANAADYVLQFKSFCGITPQIIDVITRDWVAGDISRIDHRSIGEIDFAQLFGWLKGLGMIPANFRAILPDPAIIKSTLDSYEDKRGAEFRANTPGQPPAKPAKDTP